MNFLYLRGAFSFASWEAWFTTGFMANTQSRPARPTPEEDNKGRLTLYWTDGRIERRDVTAGESREWLATWIERAADCGYLAPRHQRAAWDLFHATCGETDPQSFRAVGGPGTIAFALEGAETPALDIPADALGLAINADSFTVPCSENRVVL